MRLTLPVKIALLVLVCVWLGVGVVVAVTFPGADALGKNTGLVWQVTVSVGVVAAFLSWLAGRALMRPIQTLTQAVRGIVLGEEGVTLCCTTQDDVGELTRSLQTLLDRFHHSHAALRELTVNLDEQVRQRTSDLAMARDQAVAASQAKSEFLSTVSHEIRTPMNVVLGMLELLREAPLSHDRMEQVRLAYGSGKTLLALIDNILDFSKIEADRLTLDEMDFDLRALVDESALILATLAHTKGIELTPFFPHGMPTSVRGDVNRLRQVFTNLLGNAIKFTPEGGSVELHGGPVWGMGNQMTEYLFEVRDTGPGVPEEDRERIFNRFVQADTHRRHGYPGTGLGLAISKRLVELMGGEIGVDVNPYAVSGSIFYFSVKLANQPCPSMDEQDLGVFHGLRVLGVEIDGLQRIFLDDVFTRFGARFNYVIEATSALDALRQAKSSGHPYDLVVCNQKPGRDSRHALRQLRYADAAPRFILLTDLLDQGWDQAADLPGLSICLKKPVSAQRLRSAMEWVLCAKEGEKQPENCITKELPIMLRYDAWILLVDDHAANLTVARGMLARLGCDPARVVTAVDGRDGVARFQEKPFQLVFMDCQMPGMDGYEASRLIRQWEQQQQKSPVPIVAFTANVTSGNRQQGERSGMDAFLAKPVTLNELQVVLERFLRPLTVAEPQEVVSAALPQEPLSLQPDAEETDLDILKVAMESIGLPEEDFKDVAGLLANQIPELLESLKRNLIEGDFETARATAHVLKGSMANTIFPQLQIHTRSLHEKIKGKAWEEAQESLHRVHTQFVPVQKALQAFLRQEAQS